MPDYPSAWFDTLGPSDYPIGVKVEAGAKHYMTVEAARVLVQSLLVALEEAQGTVVEGVKP